MNAGYTSMRSRLYVWSEQHRGHDVDRQVVYVLRDDTLDLPPAPEITLRCLDCGESMLMAI